MVVLNRASLADAKAWEAAGISIPNYDVDAMVEKTKANPVWLHIGPGNLFRAYIAKLGEDVLRSGAMDRGVIAGSAFPNATLDEVYADYDNLTLQVIMFADGHLEKNIVGSIAEYISYDSGQTRFEEIARAESLQMISFTITEKGYQITGFDGGLQDMVVEDIEKGPGSPKNTMSIMASLLYQRFQAGAFPVALVSMDNFSHNGDKLRDSIVTVAKGWVEKGHVDAAFIDYLTDPAKVGFPCSTIDKITPASSKAVGEVLLADGFESVKMHGPEDRVQQAAFVNTESAQYLVIEDAFPNGKPPLDQAGVYYTDRDTVDAFERMKVCTCLNPLHTAMSVYGCMMGHTSIAGEMEDSEIVNLITKLAYDEGMKVVTDPGIVKPEDFLKEVLEERLPNKNIPDQPQRIATDTSQKIPIRFGENIKAYRASDELNAEDLVYIPASIAGWVRYLMGLDDNGEAFTVSPDPLLDELKPYVEKLEFGNPDSVGDNLKPILSNPAIMGVDLYEDGLGAKVEGYVAEMLKGKGAIRAFLKSI